MRRAALAGVKDPPNCPETSGLALARRECGPSRGEGQDAGSKPGATARRGNAEPEPPRGPRAAGRREPGSPWPRRAAAARQAPRSASELCISRERDPPGAGSWPTRQPSALLKFCPGREDCEGTQKGERTRGWSGALFAAQRVLHRYISLLEPRGRDLTISTAALAWNCL